MSAPHGAAPGGSSAAGAGGSSRRTATPPTRESPQPSHTPPVLAPNSRPSSSHRTQRQTSSGQLNAKAMNSAKSFESTRSRGSRDSLIPRTADAPPVPNAKEELLKTLQSQFESLRHIITCKICYGLMYEPYITTCGHTYCYVCFCKSFHPKQIPACPECRGKLDSPPAPAYAVREMVHAFVAKQELLPTGESLEDHKGWQKEHADIIQKDKDNNDPREGGLWRGFFRARRRRLQPIHDYEDGVDRCPFCTYELEDGMCTRCGLPIDENGNGDWEFSDMASTAPSIMGGHDIFIEEDYDLEDDFIDDEEEEGEWADQEAMDYAEDMGLGQPFAIQRMLGGHRPSPRILRPASHSAAGSRSRYSASVHESEMDTLEEADEDEEDSSMSGFVVGDDEIGYTGRPRGSTAMSETHSSRFPESIAEDDEEESDNAVPLGPRRNRVQVEEESDDDVPLGPRRNRMQRTISSTPTITSAAQHPSQSRSQQLASQTNRRRRVISETPSTESIESASSASAPAEDDEDDVPVGPANRRRRRPVSQEEPTRRVRPRARGNSFPEEEGLEARGYRPLGTPQIHDRNENAELSDGGRTEVGWEPITHPNERLRDTGSLTPTADRPSTPPPPLPRPASRNSSNNNRFPRGIRRRSSIVSVVHYEDNDADGESDTQQVPPQPVLHTRSSRARLHNSAPQPIPSTALAPSHLLDASEDTDSGDTETSPQAGGLANRRRDYNPYLSMLLAQHRTDVQSSEPEGPVYAEFEHLRGIVRTPVARPRTSNRNRGNQTAQSTTPNAATAIPATSQRTMQQVYSPQRFRGLSAELMQTVNVVNAIGRPTGGMQNSPRNSISGPSQMSAAARYRGMADPNAARQDMLSRISAASQLGSGYEPRVQANNAALLRSLQNQMSQATAAAPQPARQNNVPGGPQSPRVPHVNDFVDRPSSRVGYRNGYVVQHAPVAINRPPSNTNRPPSAGSRRGSLTRSPFAPPQIGPAGVGLGTARAWHPTNPFFNGVRPRQSNQRLRNEPSTQTLRPQRSVRVLPRQAPQAPQAPSPGPVQEPEHHSPQMRPSASRMHLRPQPSYRALHVRRDPYQQAAVAAQTTPAAATRYSPGSSASTMSEDERLRRANELVQRRMQELRGSAPTQAQTARMSEAAARQRIEQRIADNMRRSGAEAGASVGAVTEESRPAGQAGVASGVGMQQAPAGVNRGVNQRPAANGQSNTGHAASSQAAAPARAPLQSQASTSQANNYTAQSPAMGLNRASATPQAANAPANNYIGQAAAPAANRPLHPAQAHQRAQTEQAPARNQVPAMAHGVTAITTGGDNRRI